MSHPVRVVLIEDHEMVQVGLKTMLAKEALVHVIGTAASGEKGLELIGKTLPEVALVDYDLPAMSGTEVCERLAREHPKIPVIILTSYLADTIVRKAMDAGAKGYIYKDAGSKKLSEAIQMVANGGSYLDKRVVGRVMDIARRRRSSPEETILSPRETELLRMVSRGASDKEIAKAMIITTNTVKTYLHRVFFKLGCHNRAEAAALAAKWGLL